MTLPATFIFSQSSLKDYRDCPRRFQLRYLERLAWPVPQTADAVEAERRLRLGQDFHRLVRRHQAGLPAAALAPLAAADADLARRWQVYLASPYASPAGAVRRAELTLSAPLAGYRVEAQYDLVAGTPGGDWLIVDWKTGEDRSARARLEAHPQTVVYRAVLALAGGALNGGPPIAPAQITMVYWFAAGHRPPEVLPYSTAQFARDGETLAAWVREIASQPEGDWPMAADAGRCVYCPYRSFCARQVDLPSLDQFEAAGELDQALAEALDLVEEIEF